MLNLYEQVKIKPIKYIYITFNDNINFTVLNKTINYYFQVGNVFPKDMIQIVKNSNNPFSKHINL